MRVTILKILIVSLLSNSLLISAGIVDIKIVEAYKSMRYMGQKVAKEYLFLYKNPNRLDIRELLSDDIKRLESYVQDLEDSTKIKEINRFLVFIKASKERLKGFVDGNLSIQGCNTVLNYSEKLLNISNSMENIYKYKLSPYEKRLLILKDMEYLLQRVVKYYLAYTLEIDKSKNFNNISSTIEDIDKKLDYINEFEYSDYILNIVLKLNRDWLVYKTYLHKVDELNISNLVFISTDEFEHDIKEISSYLKQNQ